MLGKLLKYDLKSVGKYWWMLMIAVLGLFGVGGAAFGIVQLIGSHMYDQIVLENDLLGITLGLAQAFLTMTFIASLVGIGICSFAVSVLIYIRYFKHLFTDEGYLTFTLPVSRGQIFNAKVLNSFIWSLLSSIVMLIGASLMIALMSFGASDLRVDTATLKSLIGFVTDIPFTQWLWFAAWGVIVVLISIASFILTPCAAYFCITLGATVFKRAKLVGAIGTYVLMDVLTQLFIQVAGNGIVFYLMLSSMGIIDILSKATDLGLNAMITAFLLIILAVVATLAAFFYSVTRNILERKLNLA